MLSLMSGGSAALGVNRYVANASRAGVASGDAELVVVAAADIPRGAWITAALLETREYPRGVLPPGALKKVEDAVDRSVFVPLIKGEPVLDAKLAPKGARRGMAALVPGGMRAFTILTPSVASGVGGFIQPGNKVDVLLTMEGRQGTITTTLVQNLEILAVDQRIDAPADNRVDPGQLRSVTLLVTPDQAAWLGLAQNKGALHLSLRNHADDRPASTAPARLAELDGLCSRPEPPAAPRTEPPSPPARFLTIYRAGRPVERYPLDGSPATPVATVSREAAPGVDDLR
jgi:pilus assembly protein CpaB